MHVGKSISSALVFKNQLFVINAHQMQNGGLKVVDMYRVFGHVVPEFIGFTITDPGLYPSSGHPGGKTTRMMIAPVAVSHVKTL
jgi:hypothetical protein